MKTLVINKTKDRVYILVDFSGFYDLGSVNCAFGNVLTLLESEFSAENYRPPEFIVKYISDGLAGKAKTADIWGMTAKPTLLHLIYNFFDGKEKVDFTLNDIERMRIQHGININNLPLSIVDFDEGMKFQNISTHFEVIYALLYYYAYTGHKLAKCEHCGRWFATKNLKEKYCTRNSPFAGYESYSCKSAVKTIKDMLEKKRISEYERLRVKAAEYGSNSRHTQIFNDFCVSCDGYKAALKKGASVELLQEYKDFLFDSANVRPKYGRIKNW